jgi:hypothetical protein
MPNPYGPGDPKVCLLCVKDVEPDEPVYSCQWPVFTREQMDRWYGPMSPADEERWSRCGGVTHTRCLAEVVAPRSCCTVPRIPSGTCVGHAMLAGFQCYDCNRWHDAACAAQRVVVGPQMWYAGLCNECVDRKRVSTAVDTLAHTPADVLEAFADAVGRASQEEYAQMAELLRLLGEFRSVRVPNAQRNTVSLSVLTAAARRTVLASRALQSGLEREFYELLSELGLAGEFTPQRVIPVDVAALSGTGRRSVTTTPDFAHCALPYLVYLDGRIAHATEEVLARDGEITTELVRMGFLVRRFRSQSLMPRYRRQTGETLLRDLESLRVSAVRRAIVP